ncbi:lysis system i-spanin subunit Rz [Proteus mirabilis]|uniref:lysis system i-spanin subunit Rz n=1 Tax=Proteus mirabilis TaxID=584 RepID=UPI001A1A342B|nr:lysis system i-spanin subunit Rz [Proteus mirabilis]DAL55437.1 MAG TPA_asm: Rz lysis protein [Caudoviricetes sp.]MBI6328208.1 lysis protein [Proteus mirabilis]MCL8571460.1 lysis protein [Proteus mirabilis]MCL8624975.1 lysis protein [Proteus mirabilis]HCR4059118.1 lysis protein [Proteus mirabilis]
MKYWKFYIVVVIVGIVAGGCALINAQAKRINTLTENNKELTTALEEQKDINTDYQVRIERLNQLDTRRTQELVNAKNEISHLRDISERHPERVYIKAECPKVKTTPSTSLAYATTARPTDTAIRNYWLLREQIAESEQMIKGLQDYIKQECME